MKEGERKKEKKRKKSDELKPAKELPELFRLCTVTVATRGHLRNDANPDHRAHNPGANSKCAWKWNDPPCFGLRALYELHVCKSRKRATSVREKGPKEWAKVENRAKRRTRRRWRCRWKRNVVLIGEPTASNKSL